MIGACALLAWVSPIAVAQDTSSPPKATVSIGVQAVAADLWGGGCTFIMNDDGTRTGYCPSVAFPPTRFSDLTATGEPAIVRFDRPIALHPYAVLHNRDPLRRTQPYALTPVQRDELTWEVPLPSFTEPLFLTFGGNWSSERARGDVGYVVGVLPAPVDSALEIRKVKWTGARLTASGNAHPYAGSVILRFTCKGTEIAKTVPAGAGQWSVVLRTPSTCATTSAGRLVVRVSSTERLRAGKASMRVAHRIPRRRCPPRASPTAAARPADTCGWARGFGPP